MIETVMASPFQNNKKTRRRWRKAAISILSHNAQWEKTAPETAESLRKISKIYTRIAHSKRRKATKKPKIKT
jgi:hypothetical protein